MELRKLNRISMLSILLSAALFPVGCRNLKVNEPPSPGLVLPNSQMESDSVAVRVAIAELDDQQQTQFQSFIESTDFQKIPVQTRRRLDENGFRVSVVSSVNSFRLQRLLAPLVLKPEWLNQQELELSEAGKLEPIYRISGQRHVEKKRGESFTIEVTPQQPSATWQIHVGERTFADRARLAQCYLRVTSWPQPDGSVNLQFIPEIHHGLSLSRVGVSEQNLSVEQRREVKELRALTFDVSIQPGETVVIAPTSKLERMGKLFFGANPDSGDTERPSEQAASLLKDDPLLEDFFPMINELDSSEDPSVLVQDDQLKDIELSTIDGRPKPWQRFLLVRVLEVTEPAVR